MTLLIAISISILSLAIGGLGCYLLFLRPIEEELKRLHLLFTAVNEANSDSMEKMISRLDDLDLIDPEDMLDDAEPHSDFHSGKSGTRSICALNITVSPTTRAALAWRV